LIAASLSAPANALPLRLRPSAKQKMMLEFRPRNACEILQFFFASAFGTAQKMPRQRGSRRGIVAGLVVDFNDAQPMRAPLREPYAVGKKFETAAGLAPSRRGDAGTAAAHARSSLL
jgi:hypothetical protein